MSWIWTLFLLLSLVSGIRTGHIAALSTAALEGAGSGIQLAITLAGPLCLWSGLAHVMEHTGWMKKLAQLLEPVLQRLFPHSWCNPVAREALCGNLSANLLGLGNAATPLGIRAVQEMAADAHGQAGKELCRLVVMNTASIQLIPTTVAALRSSLGSAAPFDILPAVWITSLCSVTAGLLAAKVLAAWVG